MSYKPVAVLFEEASPFALCVGEGGHGLFVPESTARAVLRDSPLPTLSTPGTLSGARSGTSIYGDRTAVARALVSRRLRR